MRSAFVYLSAMEVRMYRGLFRASLGFLCAIALLVPVAAHAVEAKAPTGDAGATIGYVDFKRALNEVTDGRAAKQRLKDEFKEKQAVLTRLQKELRTQQEAIDDDRASAPVEVIRSREERYSQKYLELQQRLASFQREMSLKEEQLTDDILSRLRTIVRELGEKQGYTLILEKSQDIVLYAPNSRDLTDGVIAQYNARHRGKKR